MIIVCLKGGLGNQLFQYAAGRTLAHIHNTILKLDTTQYYYGSPRQYELCHFNIQENIATVDEIKKFTAVKQNKLQKILHFLIHNHPKLAPTHIRYNKTRHNPRILQLADNIYLEGYFQSEKYFKSIENIIRQEFTFKNPPDETNRKIAEQIANINSVSIHIRRGDYVEDSKANKTHGCCTLEYYHNCIDLICQKVKDPHFFIFSNQPDWCRENLNLSYPATFISHNAGAGSYEDLRLMSLCKHNIIANSTFSWWAAWLNPNPDKIVIAPERWFAQKEFDIDDIIPPGWIKI